jgi:hypothetical protein
MSEEMQLTDEQVEKIGAKAVSKLKVLIAAERFKKEFKQRSFSGRNPQLGPMIKCVQCGLRHRDNVQHEPTKYVAVAETKHMRGVRNPFWRTHPGKFQWIKELKKFVRITS